MTHLQALMKQRRGTRYRVEMARLAGMNYTYYSQLESGERPKGGYISRRVVFQLAKGLRVSPLTIAKAWLADGKGE